MTLRIVNETGNGYQTKVLDAETGEDLTAWLHIGAVSIDLDPARVVTAELKIWTPPIDITVEEAQVRHICPYCGHEQVSTITSASDVQKEHDNG